MFGGDLPVMHQSRKCKRKMQGRPYTQRFHGCIKLIIHGCAQEEGNTIVLPRQRGKLYIS
ncbi:hypothetical protein A8L34_27065 [Bacillus sp. FJAT-27264]|nr:hypothetical protein A8L34_27065 [Bacillus sp. FJAT-27264]